MSTILITGANRGLGLEFTRQYGRDNWKVIATCRNPEAAEELHQIDGDINIYPLDVNDFMAIEETAELLKAEKIDILLNNAGVLGSRKMGFGETQFDNWSEILRINTLAPLKMVESFLNQIVSSEKKIIVSISSLLGSISANNSGTHYAYRSSKAALNAVNKSLSVDLADKGVVSVVVSPGWVRTDMGGPAAAVEPVDSVSGIRKVIDELTQEDTGKFFNFAGEPLEW
jgi:NAD(P)-dependent dehydrogenase (short-subunit alcohol dehydrogenase family)